MVNKTLLKRVSRQFCEWIHNDSTTKDVKLRLVRNMTTEDIEETVMLEIARTHVATALVAYAQGNPHVTTVKPYGLKAGRSTIEFKLLPSTTLALTFAALYQVIRMEPHLLDKWIKTPRQNITNPWPRGMIKRYVSLQGVFEKYRYEIFQSYEDSGGEYMGEEERRSITPTQSPMEEFDEDFD